MEEVAKINQELISDRLDDIQSVMATLPQVDCEVRHRFTNGLYIRTIFMPADTYIVSKIHKYQHPFEVLRGKVIVYNNLSNESALIEALFEGITEPGTRRALHILEDCIWRTFHVVPFITGEENDLTDEQKSLVVKKVEEYIIEPHEL